MVLTDERTTVLQHSAMMEELMQLFDYNTPYKEDFLVCGKLFITTRTKEYRFILVQ